MEFNSQILFPYVKESESKISERSELQSEIWVGVRSQIVYHQLRNPAFEDGVDGW